MKAYVIGSGIAGVTAARILHTQGWDVEVFETRNYVSGNCYDYIDAETGCVVHAHGPHAIHTDSKRVWDWLNLFSEFNNFSVQVWGRTDLGIIPIPYNDISDKIIGKFLSDNEIKELVFRAYSEKMWGVKMEDLPPSILKRIPIRKIGNSFNFTSNKYQGLPKHGFVKMFENILNGIKYNIGVNKNEWKKLKNKCDLMVYTGKVDEYFNFEHGALKYRSLEFESITCPRTLYVQLNECNYRNKWTRAIDHSYWYGQDLKKTIVTKEYPVDYVDGKNNPYYPMVFGEHLSKFSLYTPLIKKEKNTIFVGRTATYRYLTIDQTIIQVENALKKHICKEYELR
jgi:UDP-galactopyranose mutase